MKPKQFTIGRDGAHADVVPNGANLNTVSRCHLKVTANWSQSTFRIQDNQTANGTFAKERGKWTRIDKAVVELHTPLKLGQLETSFASLLDKINRVSPRDAAPDLAPSPPARVPSRPTPDLHQVVRRDPITGQIIE